MANPFLVLGGVAVGVITAGIGVLQVPGWIDSANDSAATQDLSQVALSQEAAATVLGEYQIDTVLLSGKSGNEITGVKFQPSAGVVTEIITFDNAEQWAAVSVSKSGNVFVRTSDSTKVYKSDEKAGTDLSTLSFATKDGEALAGFEISGTKAAPVITVAP